MPKGHAKRYTIRQNYRGKKGWSVVGATGVVHGTHATRAAAVQQQAAIYASQAQSKKSESGVVTNQVTPNKNPQAIRGSRKKKKPYTVMTKADLYSLLTPEEKAFHDALLAVANEHGPFDQGTSSIWVGYETARENEDADIGVKCSNCSFFNAENNGCALVSFEVEPEGKCRLAAIPDGLVDPSMDDEMDDNVDDDIDMEDFMDDMMQRIGKADSVRVGEMVSWGSSGGTARGKVLRVIRNGKYNVPNSDFTITGTPDDPAAAIRVYRDGEPTDTIVGHKVSTLRRVGKSMDAKLEEAIEALKSINFDDDVEKKDYSTEERRQMASRGTAMPDGSFPIANRTDLANAIQSVGRASNYDAARRHIISRARALGAVDMLPEDWNVSKSIESDTAQQTEVPKDLSAIFTNMPTHAKRVNTTGNAPISLNLFRETNG